jgi:hypothetical protein
VPESANGMQGIASAYGVIRLYDVRKQIGARAPCKPQNKKKAKKAVYFK